MRKDNTKKNLAITAAVRGLPLHGHAFGIRRGNIRRTGTGRRGRLVAPLGVGLSAMISFPVPAPLEIHGGNDDPRAVPINEKEILMAVIEQAQIEKALRIEIDSPAKSKTSRI
jgi:hypothetical protein